MSVEKKIQSQVVASRRPRPERPRTPPTAALCSTRANISHATRLRHLPVRFREDGTHFSRKTEPTSTYAHHKELLLEHIKCWPCGLGLNFSEEVYRIQLVQYNYCILLLLLLLLLPLHYRDDVIIINIIIIFLYIPKINYYYWMIIFEWVCLIFSAR